MSYFSTFLHDDFRLIRLGGPVPPAANIQGNHANVENVVLDYDLIPAGSHNELHCTFEKNQGEKVRPSN